MRCGPNGGKQQLTEIQALSCPKRHRPCFIPQRIFFVSKRIGVWAG
jgi:hypothetical protein